MVGAVAYSIQLYCDFAGYSEIALGIMRMVGFDAPKNFERPYFSRSIQEFWRRWHISLSSWLRDYVYIPLGGSRKGKLRKYINLMVVFLISGIWHGAGWTFVIWGAMHGAFQIVGAVTKKFRMICVEKSHVCQDSVGWRFLQQLTTFTLVTIAWIFFRAANIENAIGVIHNIFIGFSAATLWDQSLYTLGVERQEFWVVVLCILLVCKVSKYREQGNFIERFEKQPLPLRWCCYYGILAMILVFGIYGPGYNASSFIYAGF